MLHRQSNSSSILTVSPTFSSYSSTRFAEIASRVVDEVNREKEEEEEREENEEDFLFYGAVAHLKRMALDPPNEEEEHEEEEITPEPAQLETAAIETAGEGEEEEDDEEDDFEFSFVPRDPDDPPLAADEMFSNGQIRPIWPIFNQDLIFSESNESDENSKQQNPAPSIRLPMRKLLTKERSQSSSESGALDGIPTGSYCVWRPKAQKSSRPESASASSSSAPPGGCKKSNSTGSSKVWRFRDLMHRSSSNGQDTMVFLSTDAIKGGERKGKAAVVGRKKGEKKREVSAHEIYLRNRMMSEGDRRRSFLPYRQDLVGFFANVNGLSRSLHPF